ncbi:hypothetical protein GLYMA_01G000211v4 [Glycine max]|nr:hypothetical protein GLYMA_01G000211v4 [Glycine max]
MKGYIILGEHRGKGNWGHASNNPDSESMGPGIRHHKIIPLLCAPNPFTYFYIKKGLLSFYNISIVLIVHFYLMRLQTFASLFHSFSQYFASLDIAVQVKSTRKEKQKKQERDDAE